MRYMICRSVHGFGQEQGRAACPPKLGGQHGRSSDRARGGSYAEEFKVAAFEPSRLLRTASSQASPPNLGGECRLLCMLFILLLSGCRQKMADQPRYDPLQESEFYSDQLSARPLPEGVVSRDFIEKQEFLDTGTIGGQPADRFPYPMTMELLRRGQDRYDIYCTPCHDYVGTGNGMAVQRGFRSKPPSFHAVELRSAPTGRFFDAITNGFGAMPSYASQLSVPDRWAVIAYVRALQLSQSTSPEDVPPDILQGLQ